MNRKRTVTIAVIVVLLLILGFGVFGWRRTRPDALPLSDSPLSAALRSHVEFLAGELGERNAAYYSELRRAEEYIAAEFAAAGYSVQTQSYRIGDKSYSNLIASRTGKAVPREVVIVGAHYDTASTPGADDNASGVAGLLELARLFSSEETARTVRFVAFVNEEPPFFRTEEQGSRVYVRWGMDPRETVVGAVILEMIGYYTGSPRSQRYPPPLGFGYPTAGNFIAVVGNLPSRRLTKRVVAAFSAGSPFPVESVSAPGFIPGLDLSDHRSFWLEGIPAVMVTDTAFFRNPHYHRASDTPETLDYRSMAEVVRGLEGVIRALANPRE
jgi:Zn-dependent M28 family amino/carboxypeptidase